MMSLTKGKILGALLLAFSLTGGATLWSGVEAQQAHGLPAQPQAAKPATSADGPAEKQRTVIVVADDENEPNPKPQARRPGQTATEKKLTFRLLDGAHTGGQPGATSTVFSSDNKIIAVTTGDKLRVFDAATGKVLWESPLPGGAKVIRAPDGAGVVETRVWAATSGAHVGRVYKIVDANTAAVLQNLAASEDAEVRRLATELMKRIGVDQARAEQPRSITLGMSPAPKADVAAKRAVPGAAPNQQPQHPANLEQRLNRLIEELHDLRRQIHGKPGTQEMK